MKQIRKSVFETNSSSTHVLSIEGLKGIREYTKQPLCKYSIDLVASNMLQSRLADGDKIYLQGINPIFANPDLEDRQYTKTQFIESFVPSKLHTCHILVWNLFWIILQPCE